MKIGVITFWDSQDNYGQLLQCYALQTYLKKMGHEVYLIKYKGKPIAKPQFKWSGLFRYLMNFPIYVSLFRDILISRFKMHKYQNRISEDNRGFDLFRKRYIVSTTKIYSEQELYDTPPQADAYICGSDQIWGGDFVYYLSFVPLDSLKIAYAPSFGGITRMSSECEEQVRKYLSNFTFIGVREQSGVDLCHRIGIEKAVKVVDPTLLLSSVDYNSIRQKTPVRKAYIFLYLLGNPIACSVSDIFSFARANNFEVVYVASQGRLDSYEKTSPQIGEWIDYLANADLVVTNSFHCTVFSLLFNRKFVAIPLVKGFERMNVRIQDLLSESQLESAILQENDTLDQIYHMNFDFKPFQEYREREVKKAHSYLCNSLNKKC